MALPQPIPYDAESKLKEWESVPLFMKDLPKEGESDQALDAIQALVYDGTPDEIATNFKEQGNDYFKGKRYRDALGFYTQGIDAKPTDTALLEALYTNRAACNLELQNYGSVLRDGSTVLQTNPKSLKALYRSSLALVALERAVEAIDCCNRALSVDPNNAGIKTVLSKANALIEKQKTREREALEKKAAQAEEKRRIAMAFQARNILANYSAMDSTNHEMKPSLSSDEPPNLVIPLIFLYPQYAQSDIISAFEENTQFQDHLTNMFPPEGTRPNWDVTGEYVTSNLVVYAITRRKRLLKIGKRMTLADLFRSSAAKPGESKDGLELNDGCLSVVVLPKGTVEQDWIQEFKRTKGD